jgi:insertion element IS1 protein InsB
LSWAVTFERSEDVIQEVIDASCPARWYYSDAFQVYEPLIYPGIHTMMHDKSQTYSVEGDNAELRHYLARLVRRSRCFSRCPHALHCAMRLFVYCFNARQLHKRLYPKYHPDLIDFLPTLC